jgi:sortase (surface protein transpeptidase)
MRRRTSIVVATVVIVVLLGAGALAINEGGPGEPGTRPGTPVIEPAEVEATTATPAPSRSKPRARRHKRARAALPVRVQIPSIGVDARLVSLGIDATGALEAPKTFSDAGWWSGGTRPGDPGPAVIAGHVDSKTGPAVFFRLRDLHRGDAVVVTRRDGSRVRFTVQRSASYPKSRFPTHAVYGPTARPALRLITCSGTFDRSSGHYLDNTVVFAAA